MSYPTLQTFDLDESSKEVVKYLEQSLVESKEYEIVAIKKETFGHVQEYDILMKSEGKAPIQVTIAKDNTSKNIMVLEKKTITEGVQKSVIETSTEEPTIVEVSEIEKENIKVLSKLGLVKDIKEYKEVTIEEMSNNEQFMEAVEEVKESYSSILSNAVIVKTIEKKDLESNEVKVFYKTEEEIYEASLVMNEITGQTKLVEFIKVGTQYYPKSEVNVTSDLCYGYQPVEDYSHDGNLDFITNKLRINHEELKGASLYEAHSLALGNGRINYKLYYKMDSETVKYIVYYEPGYQRILEVRGSSFKIGQKYHTVEKSKQVADPYFRKIDTYIRQNR